MLHRIVTVARSITYDTLHSVGFLAFLAAIVVIVILSRRITLFGFGHELSMLTEVGVAAVALAGFVGAAAAASERGEIEARAATFILSKPVRPLEFLAGKFAGAFGAAIIAMAVVSAAFLVILPSGVRWTDVGGALVLVASEVSILAAVFSLASIFVGVVPMVLIGLAVFAVGHAARIHGDHGTLWRLAFSLLPNFDTLSVGAASARGVPLPPYVVLWGAVYGLLYSAAVLLLGASALEGRETR